MSTLVSKICTSLLSCGPAQVAGLTIIGYGVLNTMAGTVRSVFNTCSDDARYLPAIYMNVSTRYDERDLSSLRARLSYVRNQSDIKTNLERIASYATLLIPFIGVDKYLSSPEGMPANKMDEIGAEATAMALLQYHILMAEEHQKAKLLSKNLPPDLINLVYEYRIANQEKNLSQLIQENTFKIYVARGGTIADSLYF